METIDYTIGDDITPIRIKLQYPGSMSGTFKEGDIRKCQGLVYGCSHYPILVDIGDRNGRGTRCSICGTIFSHSIYYSIAVCWKKLDTLVEKEFNELTEILEQPLYS